MPAKSSLPGAVSLEGGSFVIVLACAVYAAARTIHWPLVGDASLMHYVAFLVDHRKTPYRDIRDINMPGAWLVDYAVMHTLGGGPLVWRIFDLLLGAAACAATMAIAGRSALYAGGVAGATFALVHLQDGLYEAGQRDYVIAVLVLAAYAALFAALRRGSAGLIFAFGLLAGLAATIKPTFLPLGPILLLIPILFRRSGLRKTLIPVGLLGWFIPPAGTAMLLWRMQAWPAFASSTRAMLLYHSALPHRGLGYLLLHSISPLLALVVFWACTLRTNIRKWLNWEGAALGIGLMVGLGSYILQGKGYSYHRYPLIALLLVVIAMDYARAVQGRRFDRVIGLAGFACITLCLAPVSAWRVGSYDWRNQDFLIELEHDLTALGGPSLSQHVQCIDTIEGCYTALYNLQLVSSTGYLYDEFLFGDPGNPVIAENRSGFWRDLQASPPQVVVVTDGQFPSGPGDYRKLAMWPLLNEYLSEHYRLCGEGTPTRPVRWWSRAEAPNRFRIYCRAPR